MFEFFFKYSLQEYSRGELILAGDWPAWLVTLLAAGGIVGITVLLYRRRGHATPLQLVSIWLLQAAMLAVVLIVLMQPALQTEQSKPGENEVALLVDTSASMAYGEGRTRISTVLDSFSTITANNDIELSPQLYTFSAVPNRVDSFGDVQATGAATSIGDALIAIIDGARSQSLAAIILGSDGIDTSGGISSEQLAEIAAFGVPIHTIAAGRELMPEDLEISQVLLPEKALPASTVSARVSIRHDRAGEARLSVYDGDRLVAIKPVLLPENASTTTAWIDVDLQDPGYHRLQFSIVGDTTEPEQRNNQRSSLLKIEEKQFRVLYFEGEPRWEYKFMRRALDSEQDIRLISLLRVSPNKFYRQGLESAEQLDAGFPSTRDELFAYDALIIGSIEAASFSDAQLGIISDFVSERGGSLLMLAGPKGLGNGGWGQSALADLLPAKLPPSTTDSFVRRKMTVALTAQGADTQMLKLAELADDNLQAWTNLPQIADYQTIAELKPAAMRLLSVDTDSGAQPLLVSQPYGRGNSYILATGGTWRWQMSMPVEDQSHETFWRQLLRALVSAAPANSSLSVTHAGGDSGARLRAEFRDAAFRPRDDISVTAVVSHEDGESFTLNLNPSAVEPGIFVNDAMLDRSGTWFFEAIGQRDAEVVATARTSMYSESGQAEFFNIRRNTGLLQRISAATGGQFFEADNLAALPDLLRYSKAGITENIIRPVWDALAVFLLLLGLKSGEWLLRRRWSTI